jgi:hypothetical protein
MAYLRLFRRIKIAPGLTLNLAKHGPSLSFGVRGAHMTVGRRGIRRTVGVPGTGVFYTSQHGWHSGLHTGEHFAADPAAPKKGCGCCGCLAVIILLLLLLPIIIALMQVGKK